MRMSVTRTVVSLFGALAVVLALLAPAGVSAQVGPGSRVLEIGCGWGGFAIHAVQKYGARVTATTISREQYGLAARRVTEPSSS